MEIDWGKVFEVFGSGIFGVYLVMFLLMILTKLSNGIIKRFEQSQKKEETEQA
ncbi:hypothetical protein [Geopsychrobacter electrodiphilus]|uniref:hypothetical protein n=1 Tax=Geopsychrobacter electrodiphilus TaxID=225196 RepID=UPI00036B6A52|nr:hypothetical protein [Geopsychrobacter electrodiphilus]